MNQLKSWLLWTILLVIFVGFSIWHFARTDAEKVASTVKIDRSQPAEMVSHQKIDTTEYPQVAEKPAIPAKDFDVHGAIAKLRTAKLRQQKRTPQNGTTYKNYVELTDMKAVPSADYRDSFGEKFAEQNGYVYFKTTSSKSSLSHFDGVHFPLVQKGSRPVYGVVNGEIEVQFRNYPNDLRQYADERGLKIASELKHLNVAFLSPKYLPIDLIEVVGNLAQNPEVKKAELAIVFGKRGPH